MYIEREKNLVNSALHSLYIINIYQGFNTTIIFIYLFSIALIIINVRLYIRDISLFSSLRLFIDIKRENSTRHGRTDDHEISSDCQTNSRNEERWDRSKTGRWCSWCLTRRNPQSVIIISGTLSIERGSSRVRSIRLHLSKWEIMMGFAYIHHVKGSRENSIGKYLAA